jgi:DNA-binding response OmpR family regulator
MGRVLFPSFAKMLQRILILEDHDDSRLMLSRLLTAEGFQVMDFASATTALFEAAQDVDVALLDVRLAGRSGDDVGRELKERYPQIKIIFLTGESLIHQLKAVVPDCLVIMKPLDFSVLVKLLKCS